MRAPLSIVIPTLNVEESLPGCLHALMEGVQTGLIRDLVISDGGSTDRTLEIADAAGAELVAGAASRGGQLRRGAKAAKGGWLLFIHADTQLAPGWSDAVRDHIEQQSDKAGWFALEFDRRGARRDGLLAGQICGLGRLGCPLAIRGF
ncbi:glycosyltransferase [Rhodobacteraceae bacterium D3-12]|nr:glycosyltransferase [Rhodobacteraceae bacterium D3-12]